MANGLTELGLTKGDHVLVIAPRLIESYAYLQRTLKQVLLYSSSELLRAKDIQYRLHHAEAKAIISYHPFCNEIDKIENFLLLYNIKLRLVLMLRHGRA